ncbi:MAG: sigma-70 family RNA polymerase sigma factor [Saprospiraceae bacterium]|jgi:RNA polymerase sigma factor (sigma-70 family)|nr:sigma-70 family RNA polymerase sigma factor [Saprospiraceae bacterium]MBK7795177.1 sigma-70 family RNA polymerase sigma factor [Saprospiraceae bacterium]MBK8153669.1 sigma-70 family RNA polymerase sigma factor [Saprospiraceae bacterium]MBL0261936.1 sigma-70 family RNA polymerase sigma factor [Saprospiraceae bacterium]
MKINHKHFNQIFNDYNKRVYALCLQYFQNEENAKDAMQECFVALYYKYDTFKQDKGDFENWFFIFCKNFIISELRKQKRKVPLEILENIPEMLNDDSESPSFLHDANLEDYIQQLPNGYKAVLELFVYHNWTHKMIAEHLNISENTSKSQFYKAKKFLSDLIQNENK